MKGIKLYFGIGLSDNGTRIAKRIIPGKIKYKNEKVVEIGFREINGDSFDDLRTKFHEQIDLFFIEVAKKLNEKYASKI